MAVEMTGLEEKLWRYLVEHKTPTLASKLAKHFIISQSKASAALKKFADSGIADVIVVGKQKFYKVKD